MDINVASALCYLLGLITGIVFLVMAPYNQNKTVRFHAFQSIFVSLGMFVVHIAVMIVAGIVATVSFALASLFTMVSVVVSLAFFCLWLFMMWKTYNKETVVLPIVGPLAQKQA